MCMRSEFPELSTGCPAQLSVSLLGLWSSPPLRQHQLIVSFVVRPSVRRSVRPCCVVSEQSSLLLQRALAVESTHSYVSQWSTDIPTNMGDSVMTVVGGRMVLTKGKDNSLDQIISSE